MIEEYWKAYEDSSDENWNSDLKEEVGKGIGLDYSNSKHRKLMRAFEERFDKFIVSENFDRNPM